MKVALAIQHMPPYPGGAERQVERLALHLARALGECDVMTTRFDAALAPREVDGLVRITRLRTIGSGGVRLAGNGVASFLYALRRGHRYRVLHAHCLSAFSLGAIWGASLRDCATLVKVCSIGPGGCVQKVRALGAGRLLWRLFQRVDMFVGPSPAAVTELLANGVPPPKAVCIPNLIDTAPAGEDSKQTLRQALGLPDRPICLFVGRLIAVKGLDVLMQAWPAVRARHDAVLVVVGDGPDRNALDRWAQAPEQQGSVHVIGWQADPDPFYRVADLLVFPSRREGFANVLAEAMAHGLPIVTTPVGLASAWLHDGESALIVPPAVPEPLARAINALLEESALGERLGARARQDASRTFAPSAVVNRYLVLYDALVKSRDPSTGAPPGNQRCPDT